MKSQPQSAAGGAFIAIAILAGALAGGVSGQPTIGVLGGAAAGIAVAVWIWFRDRRRIGH